MNSGELTYAEHIEGYNKQVMEEYRDEISSIIRNITLTSDDLDSQGFLTSMAYVNFSGSKAKILKSIEEKTRKRLKKI